MTQPFLQGLREGSYNGNLEAATAVRLVSLLRYATGVLPLEGYELESGKIGVPSALVADLLDALNAGIDELTRPVDAIKHQAKTVTVGISRSEDALFGVPLVKATLAAGAAPDTLGYRALRTLGALDEAVAEVAGFTRYRIDWPPRRPDHRRRRPRRAWPGRCRPGPRRSPAAGHQAPGRRGAGGHRGPRAPATAAPSSWCPRPRAPRSPA